MTRTAKRRRPPRARQGFTIIELMIAIVVLSIGVLGLAGTSAMVSRMIGGAAQQTIAANVAASRFEKMRARQCSAITSGTAALRGTTETWTVSSVGTALKFVVDSVSWRGAGQSTSRLIFQSYVKC
ncbi:MAG: type IV pilus modification PilV family protein [Gemmatimonadaceae bacterium]